MSNTELKCFVTCSLHFLMLVYHVESVQGEPAKLSLDLNVLEFAFEFVIGTVIMSGDCVFFGLES